MSSILSQTNTGQPCPDDVDYLREKILELLHKPDSLMQTIPIYAWNLAMALDRLDYLERFKAKIDELVKGGYGVPFNTNRIERSTK